MNDDELAFPCSTFVHPNGEIYWGASGMTLRDYFAGQALIGLLVMPGEYGDEARNHPDKCAEWSYAQADAMLAERKRKKESQ